MKAIIVASVAFCVAGAGGAQTPTTYQYDALGRLTKVTNGSNVTVMYSYDAVDNRTAVVATHLPPLTPPPGSPANVVVVPLLGVFVTISLN